MRVGGAAGHSHARCSRDTWRMKGRCVTSVSCGLLSVPGFLRDIASAGVDDERGQAAAVGVQFMRPRWVRAGALGVLLLLHVPAHSNRARACTNAHNTHARTPKLARSTAAALPDRGLWLLSQIGLMEFWDHLDIDRTPFSERAFSLFDEDGSGDIDFREYLVSVYNYCASAALTL